MQTKGKKSAFGGASFVKLSLILLASLAVVIVSISGGGDSGGTAAAAGVIRDSDLTDIELLGKYVFFDKISSPKRMACVTCHLPETGGTGGVSGVNLHQVAITGANPHTVGNLKPPTNAYASLILPLSRPCAFGPPGICGGNFWNGRAEGNGFPPQFEGATKHIGEEIFYQNDGITKIPISEMDIDSYRQYFGPTADQALNPMPNPVEQNIDRKTVCRHVKSSAYAPLYKKVWGVPIDCSDNEVQKHAPDVGAEKAFDISFKRIMLAVCAWQDSADLNSFSSKRDRALRAELACACAEGAESDNYPGEEVCLEVGSTCDASVSGHSNYINSPGKFPLVGLTDQENLGHDLFYNRRPFPFVQNDNLPVGIDANGKIVTNKKVFEGLPVTNCSFCHSDNPGIFRPNSTTFQVVPSDTGDELKQLYADDAYHNIRTPANPEIPGYPIPSAGLAGLTGCVGDATDPCPPAPGPGGALVDPDHRGFHKTPTLRNVDKRKGVGFIKAYTHNGWFKSIESIVHFYNTATVKDRCPDDMTERDALAQNCWPAPEQPLTAVGPPLVGNLGLTLEQEAALVAYLKTLSDEHTPKSPKPYKVSSY
jgi:cytochrome c peroxidase